MKKYIPYLVIFLIGALAGMWAHRQYLRTHTEVMEQTDTLVILDTIKYSKLELIGKNYRLDIPKTSRLELVYIPSDSTTIVYRDSIRYITLPRQHYYTATKDAQIWHSGIDSRIDSLNVFHKTQTITHTVTKSVTKRHELSIGIGLDYLTRLSVPLQIEYSYNILPWFSIYGYTQYELFRKELGVGTGAKVRIGW